LHFGDPYRCCHEVSCKSGKKAPQNPNYVYNCHSSASEITFAGEKNLTSSFQRTINGAPEFLVVQRPSTGLLAGMWEFPSIDRPLGSDEKVEPLHSRAAMCDEYLRHQLGWDEISIQQMVRTSSVKAKRFDLSDLIDRPSANTWAKSRISFLTSSKPLSWMF
jgi:adenine-specific DNA glycosylase